MQETLPPRSNYTSLKRSQSGGTAERKNDAQKESEDLVKVEEPKVDKTVKVGPERKYVILKGLCEMNIEYINWCFILKTALFLLYATTC